MSNRSSADEKKIFPNSRERNNPNQAENRDSSLRFPSDHIYARQVDSTEGIPVRPENAEEVASSAAADSDLGAAANVLPSNLITTPTYTPHSLNAEWWPARQEQNVEANYQQAIVEAPGGIAVVNEVSIVTRSFHDEDTLQLSPLRPTFEPIIAAPTSSADINAETQNVITISASNQTANRPEQLDESIELPHQFITVDNIDLDTDKVKKLSEKLLAVYARMKNSENRLMQQVPLVNFPPIPAVAGADHLPQTSASEPTASALEPTASALEPTASALEPTASALEPTASALEPTATTLEPTAALGRQDNEIELFRRLGFNQGPNETVNIHHLTHSFVLTNQFKQLRELLVYHLDLIQNLNETITSTTKLYQDLKEENDTLKNVIKRKALPGSPQFALSHAGSRHTATTSTVTTAVTSSTTSTLSSILAPTRPQNPYETAVSHRDTATMRKLLATVRPEVARFSAAGEDLEKILWR